MKRGNGVAISTMLCPIFQLMISAAIDSRKPLGARTHRHLGRCDACKRFRETCLTLGETLRSEASALPPADGGVSPQILASPLPRRRRPSMRFVQLAAACVAIVASIFWLNGRVQPTSEPTRYAFATPDIAIAQTWTQMLAAPLVTEAQNLSNDAQFGLRFLITCMTIRPVASDAAPHLHDFVPSPQR